LIRPAPALPLFRVRRRPMTFARASLYGFVVLALVAWGYILAATDSGAPDLVSAKTWSNAGNFVRQLIGIESPTRPAYLEVDRWLATGRLALNTLAMSVLAIVLTGIAVLPTFLPGARNVSNGDLGGAPSRFGTLFYHVVRLAFTLTRAVPELVWISAKFTFCQTCLENSRGIPKTNPWGVVVVQRLTWGQGRQQVAVAEAVACLEETRPVGPPNGPGPTGLDSSKTGARR